MFFSIIIPVFNVKKYLRDSVESVLNQSFKDFELLIIDDGSNDGSSAICDNYSENDKVRVFHTKNNGVSSARNLGIINAKGRYIFFLDSDDVMNTGVLNYIHLKIKKNEDIDIMIGNSNHMLDDCSLFKNIRMNLNEISMKDTLQNFVVELIKKFNFIPWAPYYFFFRRDFILKNGIFFNELLICAEDCKFFFDLIKQKPKYSFTNYSFVNYRVMRKGSITNHVNLKSFTNQLDVFFYEFSVQKNMDIKIFFSEQYANIILLSCYFENEEYQAIKKIINKNKSILHFTKKNRYSLAKFFWIIFGYKYGSYFILHLRKIKFWLKNITN